LGRCVGSKPKCQKRNHCTEDRRRPRSQSLPSPHAPHPRYQVARDPKSPQPIDTIRPFLLAVENLNVIKVMLFRTVTNVSDFVTTLSRIRTYRGVCLLLVLVV